jgi:hypothetical protein
MNNDLFPLIGRYFWLVGIGFGAFGYLRAQRRVPARARDAATEDRIRRYRRIWFGAQMLPWLWMGLALLSGGARDVWSFMQLRDGNPFVTAFVGLVFALAVAFAGWTFAGGARTIVELELAVAMGSRFAGITERGAKALAAAGVAAVPLWIAACTLLLGPRSFHPESQTISADGYQTVYDLGLAGWESWTFPAFGLVFVLLGIGMVVFRNDLRMRGPALMRRVFPFLWLGFAVIWTFTAFASTYGTHRRLAAALADGEARVVEGEVTHFIPMPAAGHAMERFCVQQACFAYSDFVVAGGFNHTASHGGPIRAGLPVRVTYLGNVILRLEIAPGGR